MKIQDLMMMGTAAIGTATATLMMFGSGPLEAGNEGNALPAKIAKPVLVSRGVEVSLATADGRDYTAGEEPIFQLSAVNTTGNPASLEVRVAMTTSSPADALSRVPRIPAALWQKDQSLVLAPHETKIISLATQTKLPPSAMAAVSLREAGSVEESAAAKKQAQPMLRPPAPQPGIIALSFSTAKFPIQTALAK